MQQSTIWTGMIILVLSACIEQTESEKDLSALEEPSSEPAGEPSSDNGSDGDSNDSTGGDTGSSNGSDGDSGDGSTIEPSNEPSDEGGAGGSLNPDLLLFSFQHGYANGGITNVTYDSSGAEIYGAFRLILFDSTVEDYCIVNWEFDDTTVAPDTDYADGYVVDGFYGEDLEVWYGYVVLSQPQTQGSCDSLTTEWLTSLDEIKADRPGFGYGPLTEDLMTSMETEGYVPWDDVSGIIFTGIPSMTVFSEGERSYFPVNQGFAYSLEQGSVTTYDPNNHDLPQGTESSLSELPGDGFYVSQYYYGISLNGN